MKDVIRKYAKLMDELPYDVGKGVQLLVRHDDRIYGTLKGASLASIADSDIRDMTETAFPEVKALKKDKKNNAMVIFKTPYVGHCIDCKRPIPAVLDDMAQIVGHKVQLTGYSEKKIRRALGGSMAAVMLKDGYALTVGRTLYEAYVAMTVLEKSAEILIKSELIGGPVKIGLAEAKLMRLIYMKKYSKAERKVKNECEG